MRDMLEHKEHVPAAFFQESITYHASLQSPWILSIEIQMHSNWPKQGSTAERFARNVGRMHGSNIDIGYQQHG